MQIVHSPIKLCLLLVTLFCSSAVLSQNEDMDGSIYEFDDSPLSNVISKPSWFKESFFDLPQDLKEAVGNGKKGLIIYFGRQRCAYCKMLLQVDFGQTDISTYTRRNFDVVAIDATGATEVTDLEGKTLTEQEFAVEKDTTFTPSLLFYDGSGKEVFRLRGFYPPYKFRAALEYVADKHYTREPFSDYLARGEHGTAFEPGDLNEEDFFIPPPHNLDRSHYPSKRPLVVFFEQGNCHACDVLHGQPLSEPSIHGLMDQFDNVQLDIHSDMPVITPQGEKTTAKQWAKELGLFYTPSLLFFDENGKEIIRIDSVVRFYRLRSVAQYITSRDYLQQPNYHLWRIAKGY